MRMGYDFLNEALHPDDVFLWAEMHSKILKSLHNEVFTKEEVNYFECTGCGRVIMLFPIPIYLIPKLFPHSVTFVKAS